MTEVKVSDSEWEVMRIFWTQQKATSQEIISFLGEELNWQPTTVKTLISRLVKKDMLKMIKEGSRYYYEPLVKEEDTILSATESLFSHICSKRIGSTIQEIIQRVELTDDDVANINAALANKQTVKEIKCNCLPGQCECHHHHH